MNDRSTIRIVGAHRLLERAATAFPDAPAIDFLGRTWTYRALAAAVDRVAAGLQAIGVAKGDRVGLCLPNTPFSVIGYYAALKAGAIVVNFNPLYVGRELEHQIRDSGTSVMLTIDIGAIHAKVAAACLRAGCGTVVLCSLAEALPRGKAALYRVLKRKAIARLPEDGCHVGFAQLLAEARPIGPIEIGDDDIAVLQYTGGTTARQRARC